MRARVVVALFAGALAAGCGTGSDGVIFSITADAHVDQVAIALRDDASGAVFFRSGFVAAVDTTGRALELTHEPLTVAVKLPRPGHFTAQIVGVTGPLDGDKPAAGASELFWAARLTVSGPTRVAAQMLTVPESDDADRDLFPDAASWPAHVPAAAALYRDLSLLDCDDKSTVPVHDKVRLADVTLTPDQIHPFAMEVCAYDYDMNCDGMIAPCVDADGDGDVRGSDCDDGDPTRHHATAADPYPDPPNCCGYSLGKAGTADANTNFVGTPLCPTQRCGDGIDESCRGGTNDRANDTKCQIDADCDGYPPISAGGTDCDDTNAAVHPGATRQCGSGIDYDCSGFQGCQSCDLDGDGFQRTDATNGCPDAAYRASNKPVDCNDHDSSVHPGATSETTPITGSFTPGGKECAGERFGLIVTALRGLCRRVYETTATGTQTPKLSAPGYTAGDADCNGIAFEGCPSVACDADGDGFPNAGTGCNPSSLPVDCNDTDPTVFPGAPENCRGTVDQNCNAAIDACTKDADGDGYDFTVDCNDGNNAIHPFALELCDGVDNDCDGLMDEGNPDPSGAPLVASGAPTPCTTSSVGQCGAQKGECVCSGAANGAISATSYNTTRLACPGEPGPSNPSDPFSPPAYDPNRKYARCFGAGEPTAEVCDGVDNDCNAATADGSTQCMGATGKCAQQAAATYTCQACNVAADCGAGHYCDATNSCRTAIASGASCTSVTCSYADRTNCRPCAGLATCGGNNLCP